MIARVRVFLSPIFPDVDFYSGIRYWKVNQQGKREHFYGLKEKLGAIE